MIRFFVNRMIAIFDSTVSICQFTGFGIIDNSGSKNMFYRYTDFKLAFHLSIVVKAGWILVDISDPMGQSILINNL